MIVGLRDVGVNRGEDLRAFDEPREATLSKIEVDEKREASKSIEIASRSSVMPMLPSLVDFPCRRELLGFG